MWNVTILFANQVDDDGYWDQHEDTVEIVRSFPEEEEAKAFWLKAREASADWFDDEDGVRPGEKAIAFVREGNFTLYDLDGMPCGGYFNGSPVPPYQIAPMEVVSAVFTTSVVEEWLASLAMAETG